MSTTNKKGTASKALMEMDSIMKSIKEESKSTMKTLLSEAVKDALRDNASEDDDKDAEEEPEVLDGENAEKDTEDNNSCEDEKCNDEEEHDDDSMADLEKYKVGEDTYDLTGEKDNDTVVRVYKLLNDEDQVIIKKDGDKVNLKDNETGAEYVIDLGADGGEDEDEQPLNDDTDEDEVESLDESICELGDSEGEDDETEYELPTDDEDYDEDEENQDKKNDPFDVEPYNGDELGLKSVGDDNVDISDAELNDMIQTVQEMEANKYDSVDNDDIQYESKKRKKTMKESKKSKDVLFEIDLGYTDNYQKEDPIEGLSNDEPSKSGKTLDKGIPTGTKKPWAGSTSGKGNPFAKGVNEEFDECGDGICEEDDMNMDADSAAGFNDDAELEEAAMSTSSQSVAKTTHTRTSQPRAEHKREVAKLVHTAEGYVNEMRKLKKENKSLQEAVLELRNSLKEAYITNVNLGKITKLFLENTTTKAEKIDIINRFTNEAKTIDQSKALFESINKQLKKAPQMSQIAENNAGKTMTGSKVINENKTQRTKDVLEVIDLMDRMKNC